MRTRIRHVHRAAVDRLADTRWLHARRRTRGQSGPPRVLARWQTAIARLLGQSTVSAPKATTPPEGQGR
jgi:hypothetical protein